MGGAESSLAYGTGELLIAQEHSQSKMLNTGLHLQVMRLTAALHVDRTGNRAHLHPPGRIANMRSQ